jgi:hypothetical protein
MRSSSRPEGLPMSASSSLGVGAVIFLAVLALTMFFTAVGKSEPQSLADRIAELVPRYGSKSVELVDAQEFGIAIDVACNHDRECAARLFTMAVKESALSLAVSRSEYRPHEGDSYIDKEGIRQHKAWGTWQAHKNRNNAEVWGSTDLLVQAKAARLMQLGALAECRAFRGVLPEVGMWRILSGRGCMAPYTGEDARMTMLARIRRAL